MTSETQDQAPAGPKQTPLPDVGDVLFLFILILLLSWRPNFVLSDGSTGWHLVAGEYILDHKTVPSHDLISYIPFPKEHLWIAYEWLSDAVMAALVRLGGLNLLAVVVSCAIAWLFVLVYDRCRREGGHFLAIATLTLVGAISSALHWLARPHLFTFYAVYIYTTKLEDFYRGTISGTKLAVWLVACMLIWVNCHPAFLLGYALLAIYLTGTLSASVYYGDSQSGKKHRAQLKPLCLTAALVAVSTFATPYGLKLYQYIIEYLKGNFILNATDEYASPVFHGSIHSFTWEVLLFFFIVGLSVSRRRLSPPQMLTCLAFIFLSLSAVRNIPLFVIVVLPAIGLLYSRLNISGLPDAQSGDGIASGAAPAGTTGDSASTLPAGEPAAAVESKFWRRLVDKWHRIGDMCNDMEWQCKMHLLPIFSLLLLSLVAIFKVGGKDILNSRFNPDSMPVETLSFLKDKEDKGVLHVDRGLNFDNWGGYIRYTIGTPVFIDDRADFYGAERYLEYSTLSLVSPGWQDVLKRRHIEWVLFPNESRLVATLQENKSWKLVYKDKAASLYARADVPLENFKEPAVNSADGH